MAAKLGIEITSDDIARILDVTGTHGHQFPWRKPIKFKTKIHGRFLRGAKNPWDSFLARGVFITLQASMVILRDFPVNF